ncbi:MAG TPA: hypothetical protein VMR59_03190 [Patescibacteria group bacterium]|jgi:hypothetical protein|nr:hypothetical protein [Patescibacteria group bacterium]
MARRSSQEGEPPIRGLSWWSRIIQREKSSITAPDFRQGNYSGSEPTQPAVEFFGADGSRRDATEELRRCFESPAEIDPSTLPIEFARKVEAVLDAEAAAKKAGE